jgi:hypothetical protein
VVSDGFFQRGRFKISSQINRGNGSKSATVLLELPDAGRVDLVEESQQRLAYKMQASVPV